MPNIRILLVIAVAVIGFPLFEVLFFGHFYRREVRIKTLSSKSVEGVVVGYAYDSNFLGIKTIANDFGDTLNKGIKDVGNAIDSDFKSIQKVFGW